MESHEDTEHLHDHDHDHGAHSTHSELSDEAKARQNVMRRLKIATALCIFFFLVEVIGGLLAGSLAVLSDAAHLFSDLASFAVAIVANYLASLPSTAQHTFGLKRTESLAALFSMVSLALVCVWLGGEALRRLYDMVFRPDVAAEIYDINGKLMCIIASIGVFVNVALAFVLGEHHVHLPGHDHSHDHDHGDSHGHSDENEHSHSHGHSHERDEELPPTERSSLMDRSTDSCADELSVTHLNELPPPFARKEQQRNVNLHAAYLHVLGDLAQSVAVLIAGVVIWLKPTWIIVDPICTLGFCVIVFYSTLGVLRSSVAILLEEVPPQISWDAVYNDLSNIDGISKVHCLHIWCISDGIPCISLHAFATSGDTNAVLASINTVCRRHGIEHITAQVQPGSGDDCATCDELKQAKCFEDELKQSIKLPSVHG